MPRQTAGRRYPHVTTQAKPHNHSMCPVIAAIAKRALAGDEEWGTRHDMPAVATEEKAKEILTGFYAARYCREVKNLIGESASVQAGISTYRGAYVDWVRVWPRSTAKKEIARRVAAGEQLAYNVTRST